MAYELTCRDLRTNQVRGDLAVNLLELFYGAIRFVTQLVEATLVASHGQALACLVSGVLRCSVEGSCHGAGSGAEVRASPGRRRAHDPNTHARSDIWKCMEYTGGRCETAGHDRVVVGAAQQGQVTRLR